MVIMVFNHEIIIGPQHRLQNRGKDSAVGVVIVVFSNVIARKEVIIQNLEKLSFSETFWSVEGCDKQDKTRQYQCIIKDRASERHGRITDYHLREE
jgi:hypothetical protein